MTRARPESRCFIINWVYTVASVDTQCIDSNLESGRYITRVERARGVLSLWVLVGHGYSTGVSKVGGLLGTACRVFESLSLFCITRSTPVRATAVCLLFKVGDGLPANFCGLGLCTSHAAGKHVRAFGY